MANALLICLEDHDEWLRPDLPSDGQLPGQWKRCMMPRPFEGRDSCWQDILIRKNLQRGYKNTRGLKALLGYVWLRLKFPEGRSP